MSKVKVTVGRIPEAGAKVTVTRAASLAWPVPMEQYSVTRKQRATALKRAREVAERLGWEWPEEGSG